MIPSDFSIEYTSATETNSDKQIDRDLVKPKEALDRMKFCVKKATSFIICRGILKRLIFATNYYYYFLFV